MDKIQIIKPLFAFFLLAMGTILIFAEALVNFNYGYIAGILIVFGAGFLFGKLYNIKKKNSDFQKEQLKPSKPKERMYEKYVALNDMQEKKKEETILNLVNDKTIEVFNDEEIIEPY